jgi:hypothetical protein
MGKVQFVLSGWKTENILKQRMTLWRNYSEFISLGSEILLEPSGGWDSLELESPKWSVQGGMGGFQEGHKF